MWQTLVELIGRLKFYVVIDPEENGVLVRAGRLHRDLEPGWHWLIPVIDEVTACNVVDQMLVVSTYTMTCDGKTMAVTGAIEYSITDLGMAAFKVENFDEQLANTAKAIINAALNCRSVKEIATQGGEIDEDILILLGEEAQQWGLTVSDFRIVQKCPIRPILLMNVE